MLRNLSEIGSEYWLEDITSEDLGNEDNGCYVLSGRTAIDVILQDIHKERKVQNVYLPAYCCDSMLQPFMDRGIKIHLYDLWLGDKLEYDVDENCNWVSIERLNGGIKIEVSAFIDVGSRYATIKILNLSYDITESISIKQNGYPENRVITYTTSDGNKVGSFDPNYFDVNVVSHTYNNEKGIIVFSGTLYKIGDEAFWECTTLTSVKIPNTVTKIGDDAFYKCYSLRSIYIPSSVRTICGYAFHKCSTLTSITIPKSVTTIEICAFNECSSLNRVYCESTTPPTGGEAMFGGTSSSLRIYVPSESVSKYKSATYWKDYSSKIYAN